MTRELRKLASGILRFSTANFLIYYVLDGVSGLEKIEKAIQHALDFCPRLGSFCGDVAYIFISVTVLYLFFSGFHRIATHLDPYS